MKNNRITKTPSRNLDGWIVDREASLEIFARGCRGAEIAVVEGVMGLFDGFSGADEAGSSAQMTKWLGLPVLPVADAGSMARSFAALVKGFCEFDPFLKFAGIAANHVAGKRHLEYLREALKGYPVTLLGGIPREKGVEIPERHLGLYTSDDHVLSETSIKQLSELVEKNIDLDALLENLPEAEINAEPPPTVPEPDVRIGLARDRAFCFYYADNLDCLLQHGCEIVFFSPTSGAGLPAGLDGLHLGGGYPELFAESLAANTAMLGQIKNWENPACPSMPNAEDLCISAAGW